VTAEKTYAELVGIECPNIPSGRIKENDTQIWHCPKSMKTGLGRLPVRRGPKGSGKFCVLCGEKTTAGILPKKEKEKKSK